MKDLSDIINNYKDHYGQYVAACVDRLPCPLKDEEDTRCRLSAIYELQVNRRGGIMKEDKHTEDKIWEVAHWLCCSNRRGLLLLGTLGNGKTTMLQSVYSLFCRIGVSLGDAQSIFEYFKESQGHYKYWDEKLLLIDDLGVEPARCMLYGEESYPLSRLLLHRYDRQLTTIVATNLNFEEIQTRYGDRVADRLHEMYEVIKYDADSYRMSCI